MLSSRCASVSIRSSSLLSPLRRRSRAVPSCKRVSGVRSSWEISDSRRCCAVIMRSSALTIWLKLVPAARNSCGPDSSSGCCLRLPCATSSAAFFSLRAGFARLHASHNSSGELTSIVTISSRSGRSNSRLMKSDWELLAGRIR